MSSRKEEIIRAAINLASEKGAGTISMQQIADHVGITKASLYNHFSSKDEIMTAMYETIRSASKERAGVGEIDFDRLSRGLPMKDILLGAVTSYEAIVLDPEMCSFYRIIMSQRTIDKAAAEIMVQETKTMINATKALFYALQVKKIADFEDVDAAAFSFAMAVHSIIDYELDLKAAGIDNKKTQASASSDSTNKTKQKNSSDKSMLQTYIEEFCRVYELRRKSK